MAIPEIWAWDYWEQIQLVVRGGLGLGVSRFQVQHSIFNCLAILPLLGIPYLFQWTAKITAVGVLQEQSPIINLYLLLRSFCLSVRFEACWTYPGKWHVFWHLKGNNWTIYLVFFMFICLSKWTVCDLILFFSSEGYIRHWWCFWHFGKSKTTANQPKNIWWQNRKLLKISI